MTELQHNFKNEDIDRLKKIIENFDRSVVIDEDDAFPLYSSQFDATEWVEALRSGNYQQARGYLRTAEGDCDAQTGEIISLESGYCCLGVLLDVRSDGWDEDNIVSYDEDFERENGKGFWYMEQNFNHINDNGDGTLINEDDATDMGLNERTQPILSAVNDAGFGFEWIAKWIEGNDGCAILGDIQSIIDELEAE